MMNPLINNLPTRAQGFVPGIYVMDVQESLHFLKIQEAVHRDERKEWLYVPVTKALLKYLCEGKQTSNYKRGDPRTPGGHYRVKGEWGQTDTGGRREKIDRKKVDIAVLAVTQNITLHPQPVIQEREIMVFLLFEVKDLHVLFRKGQILAALEQLRKRIQELLLTRMWPRRRRDGKKLDMILVSQIGFYIRVFRATLKNNNDIEYTDHFNPGKDIHDPDPRLWNRKILDPNLRLPEWLAVYNSQALGLDMLFPHYDPQA